MTGIDTGRTILALDELLTELGPPELADLMQHTPPGYRDQAAGAAAEMAAEVQAARATGMFDDASDRLTTEHPGWVRLPLLAALVGWWRGEADVCVHDPHPDRPQPVHAAAWRPNLVTCSACTHLIRAPRSRTCGGCGHTAPEVTAFATIAGGFSFTSAVCPGCRYWRAAA